MPSDLEPMATVLDVLLDLPLLPAGSNVAELGIKLLVAQRRAECALTTALGHHCFEKNITNLAWCRRDYRALINGGT